MLTLPDKDVYLSQLNQELGAINLPQFIGAARLRRALDGTPAAPHILIKCGSLSVSEETSATAVVSAHVPMPPVDEDLKRDYRNATTMDQRLAILARHAGLN